MAVNFVIYRFAAAESAKFSIPLLSALTGERKYFSDDSKKKINLYETLEIRSSATQEEIKKSYYDLTLKYHPDKNINNAEAALKFREISEAYEILGNYRSRKRYDRGLPVSDVKKILKHTVDHKVKYQEFFDSRTVKHTPNSGVRRKEIEDLSSYNKQQKPEIPKKENISVLQAIVAISIAVIFYISRTS